MEEQTHFGTCILIHAHAEKRDAFYKFKYCIQFIHSSHVVELVVHLTTELMEGGLDLPSLLGLASKPVFVVGILSSLGALAVKCGVLSRQETSALAAVNFYMFIPGLSFSQLASTLSLSTAMHLWPLISNMCISIMMGLLIGFLMQKLLKVDESLRNLVITCMGFRNVGNLPMVFIPTLCSAGLFDTFFNVDECTRMGYTYVAMDIAIANILQFTIAINLLTTSQSEETSDEMVSFLSSGDIELTESTDIASPSSATRLEVHDEPLKSSVSFLHRVPWRQMFPMPTQCAVLGTVVACIPPLKSLVCSEALSPLLDSLSLLGQGMVPATVPLLGAVLMIERKDQDRHKDAPSLGMWQIAAIVFVELVLLPWLLCGIAILFFHLGWYTPVDPVFVFVLFLANSSPSAIILLSLSILYKNRPEIMSKILLYSYAGALVFLPLNTAFYLKILDRMFSM